MSEEDTSAVLEEEGNRAISLILLDDSAGVSNILANCRKFNSEFLVEIYFIHFLFKTFFTMLVLAFIKKIKS